MVTATNLLALLKPEGLTPEEFVHALTEYKKILLDRADRDEKMFEKKVKRMFAKETLEREEEEEEENSRRPQLLPELASAAPHRCTATTTLAGIAMGTLALDSYSQRLSESAVGNGKRRLRWRWNAKTN
ncbi:hypothetical protein KSP39_PZI003392 [Platanthera zijinensis]|uniref:Uncharacterized protein n=1 Tax=Platanthera zijinensis TaxID=2320716 RepID=A0AAP0BXZ4_9ASPA